MVFQKVLKDIKNKNTRQKGVKAYYSGWQIFFSRLFAYERVGDSYCPIPKFANAIKIIYEMLISGSSLPEIKQRLDTDGFRDASNNKYTLDRICSVVRPIYSGYLKQGLGLKRVDNVEPIITLEQYKAAKKQLEKEMKYIQKLV